MPGKHRLGRPQPEPRPVQKEREDALWDAYMEAKHERGPDDTTTFERFFEWWEAT